MTTVALVVNDSLMQRALKKSRPPRLPWKPYSRGMQASVPEFDGSPVIARSHVHPWALRIMAYNLSLRAGYHIGRLT